MQARTPLNILISIEYIVDSWRIFVDFRTAYGTGNFNFKVKKFIMDRSWFRCSELVFFLFFSECIILISVVSYVFGGQLLYGTWDSFADFPYGVFSLSLFYLYIRILSIKLQWIKRFQDTYKLKTNCTNQNNVGPQNRTESWKQVHLFKFVAWYRSDSLKYFRLSDLESTCLNVHEIPWSMERNIMIVEYRYSALQ